jgi:hypothetical protein
MLAGITPRLFVNVFKLSIAGVRGIEHVSTVVALSTSRNKPVGAEAVGNQGAEVKEKLNCCPLTSGVQGFSRREDDSTQSGNDSG